MSSADTWGQHATKSYTYWKTVVRWIRSGTVLQDSLRSYVSLDIHREAMSAALFRAGEHWDRQQEKADIDSVKAGRGIARAYRLVQAYDADIEENMMRRCVDAGGDVVWDLVLNSSCDRAFRTKTCCLLVRSHAKAHQNKFRHRNYPFKTFGILALPLTVKINR